MQSEKFDDKIIKKNVVADVICSCVQETTTHGLDRIVKRENLCVKIFWLICFLVSTAVCVYMIYIGVLAYLQFDTVTKAQQIYAISTDFPAISICSLNAFMTPNATQFVQQILEINQVIDPNDPDKTFNRLFADSLLTFKYLIGTYSYNPNISDDVRRSFGYDINDMLLSCLYNLRPCSTNDFVWYYDVLYGNCFRFNGGYSSNGSSIPIKKSTKSGSLNGLIIELFIYEPKSVMSLSSATGVNVIVHNQTTSPGMSDGIFVSSGTQTNIQVERIFSSHLEAPYSECTKRISADYPSNLVKIMLSLGLTYTQQSCFMVCFQRYLMKKCGCYEFSSPVPVYMFMNITNSRPCLNLSDVRCDALAFSEFFSMDVAEICGNECPLECDSVTYNLYTSQADYPSRVYANSLMNNSVIQSKFANNPSELTYENLKRTMVQLSIFYGDLGYQKFEELPNMTLADLVSNVGGTLGLFLGMSFLSFVEIIDILLQIAIHKIKQRNLTDKTVPIGEINDKSSSL